MEFKLNNAKKTIFIQLFLNCRIFSNGGQPHLQQFYDCIKFPVKTETSMISPLVKWDHSVSWNLPLFKPNDVVSRKIGISLNDLKYSHLEGHKINETTFLPGMSYLVSV